MTHNIYKINHLTSESTIESIRVFYGQHKTDLDSLFKREPTNTVFQNIFNQEEMESIKTRNIPVFFSQHQIHKDDSISSIKLKLMHEFKDSFSLEEIYLFCMKEEPLSSASVYQTLTQNKKLELTPLRLYSLLSNIVREVQSSNEHEQETFAPQFNVSEKKIYDYDDILALNLDGKNFWVNKVLGQKFVVISSEYPFICNPYSVKEFDPILTKNSLTTLNSHLLLNAGDIVENNLYLCIAKNVLEHNDEEKIIKLYFPFLHEEQIHNLDQLEEKRPNLIERGKKKQEEAAIFFKDVDLFYDVYKERKNDLDYKETGIKYVKLAIHPLYKLKIPLLTVFKLLHATEKTPFIKFNPSLKQEKWLRLYSENISTDGQKIPYLSKEAMFKLLKTVGKSKSVCVYIKEFNGICEFEESGNVVISAEFNSLIDVGEIEQLIKTHANPIIDEIKTYLEQNGYVLPLFDSMNSPYVEIKQLSYQTVVGITKEIKLKKLKGCVSSIFITETEDEKKNLFVLRMKRVSNFNKLNSMEAFIIEKQKNGYRGEEIIYELLENYKDLSEKTAVQLLQTMASELQVERGVRKNEIEIKVNPGFKTVIQLIPNTTNVSVTVEGIDDMQYLKTIPVYIDSLIRLTQDKKSTGVSSKKIKELCSGIEKTEVVVEDIIMPSEDSFVQEEGDDKGMKEQGEIDDEDIVFGEEEEEEVDAPEKTKNALDMFFGENDEEEEEEEEEEEGENERKEDKDDEIESFEEDESGGGKKEKYGGMIQEPGSDESEEDGKVSAKLFVPVLRNVDGLRLNNPYIFQERIGNREPKLILKEDEGKFNSYSRVCQPNSRHPVILTQEELERIKRESKGALSEEKGDIVKYGSNPDKEFYYVCPKYWDLQRDTLITQEEIDQKGLQDKIISKKPPGGVVPKGKFIFQFYDDKEKMYPGFQVDSHPKGYCLPCCFKKWNTKTMIDRRETCSGKKDATKEKEKPQEKDDYIKGPEKFPLASGRWGYLPIGIQQLLKEDSADVKKTTYTLLRHGVETSRNQSFLACISDAIFYTKSDKAGKALEVASIKQFKELIISSLTLDNFIQFQNGNLVADFSEPKKNVNLELPLYKKSKLAKKLKDEPEVFLNICNSFENFISYLKDDVVTIDYTYLWDLVCSPNPVLFPNGINLVVLDITSKDATNDVSIICPTNRYSNDTYNINKSTLVLIKQDDYFEPIYSYREQSSESGDQGRVLYIGKLFKETDAKTVKPIRYLFNNVVKPFYQKKCVPFSSMPEKYKMKTPILLDILINKLREVLSGGAAGGETIQIGQVINYQGKVIGVVVQKGSIGGYVPCYPSSILEEYDYFYANELSLWKSYEQTVAFLMSVWSNSRGKIPCKPGFKVVEDEVIVGILTETNQFIQINPPLPVSETHDDIPELRESNYMLAENEIAKNKGQKDTERIEYIQKIKLETKFYQAFRNTVRMLLNDYKYLKLREAIEETVNAPYMIYQSQIQKARELLTELTKTSVVFVDNFDYKTVKEVTTCLNKSQDKCAAQNPVCMMTAGSGGSQICQLILPMKNLVTGRNNAINYHMKIADELIRYSRIKSFLFEPQSYLSFAPLEYKLRDDEFIIMQSLVTQDYFKSLTPVVINPYVKFKGRDEV
jgi:hypothetical protein